MENITNLDEAREPATVEDEAGESVQPDELTPLAGIATLRRNRQLVYLSEWVAAQAPWRRRFRRSVRERLRAA